MSKRIAFLYKMFNNEKSDFFLLTSISPFVYSIVAHCHPAMCILLVFEKKKKYSNGIGLLCLYTLYTNDP